MPKFQKVEFAEGSPDFTFDCPGCENSHGVWTKQRNSVNAKGDFNGDLDKPTVSSSILVRYPIKGVMGICHSFIRDGKIEFLGDCTHHLAGKTVELPEV
jgi:hypothetical protein